MTKRAMKSVGKSIPIMEARDKVTGRALYVDDMQAELFVKILGSPHAHARVKNIDTNNARMLSGVKAILTHKEVTHRQIPFGVYRPCYAIDDHLRHVGDYVAAVAATSEAIAEHALELIKVDYEVLPAVFEVEEAAKPNAPKIYPEGNVQGPSLEEWGDINKGFADADVIVEDYFDITPQVHSPIETHVCMARWQGDELTIWCSTQTPWELRNIASYFFEIPESKVTVLTPNIGGGFGSKYTGRYQIITCLVARIAGSRLTKLTFTREEEQCYTRRIRGKICAKVGAKTDGTIIALQLKGYFDIGAYERHYATWCSSIGYGTNSYKVANARFESYNVFTNHIHAQSMRSVSAPFFAFPMESIIDELAEKLGMDPIEIRLRNMPETGDTVPPTPYINNSGGCTVAKLDTYPARQMIEQVIEAMDWKRKWRGFSKPTAIKGSKRRGIGLAYMMMHCGYCWESAATMQVIINHDGSAVIHSGATELGQGINTTLRMLAAESLNISLADVAIVTGDTSTGQNDTIGAKASRQLVIQGHLLLKAIEEAKQKIRDRVAIIWDTAPELIVIEEKSAHIEGQPEGAKPLRNLLSTSVTGCAAGAPGSWLPDIRPGFRPYQPVVLAAEVEVDIETGEVKPIKLVPGMFPRRMINPGVVRGQCLGGTVMTLGMALWEEVKYDEGAHTYLSRDFTDYKIPRVLDIPEIEPVLLEEIDETIPPYEGLPYGGAGLGELSAWGGPAAIANAIYNATGARIRSSPMTAEEVLQAIEKAAI